MNRVLFVSFLLILLLLEACNPSGSKKEILKEHFDIPGFFEEEINQLEKKNQAIEKKINKDGKTETKTLQNVDWEKELAPFVDNDINKPSWVKNFFADTVFLPPGSFEITYTSIDLEIPIKQVKLLFENYSCSFVQINKNSNNKLFSYSQNLEYGKGKGYKINGYQKVKYTFDTRYEIISEFIINKKN